MQPLSRDSNRRTCRQSAYWSSVRGELYTGLEYICVSVSCADKTRYPYIVYFAKEKHPGRGRAFDLKYSLCTKGSLSVT
jgi:hypothetical protein